MKYNVTCTLIYNGNVEVEANSREEAIKKAENAINDGSATLQQAPSEVNVGTVPFTYGECTADYAEPLK